MDTIWIVSLLSAVVSSIVSYGIARAFGSTAGAKAANDYEKERAQQARLNALRALSHQTDAIAALAEHNSSLEDLNKGRAIVRMPVAMMETAFLSAESILTGVHGDDAPISECLPLVNQYLVEAYAINALSEAHVSLVIGLGSANKSARDAIRNQIAERSSGIPSMMTELKERIESAIAKLTAKQ